MSFFPLSTLLLLSFSILLYLSLTLSLFLYPTLSLSHSVPPSLFLYSTLSLSHSVSPPSLFQLSFVFIVHSFSLSLSLYFSLTHIAVSLCLCHVCSQPSFTSVQYLLCLRDKNTFVYPKRVNKQTTRSTVLFSVLLSASITRSHPLYLFLLSFFNLSFSLICSHSVPSPCCLL